MPNIGPFELFLIVLPLFWILPAYLVARFAERRKGQSFGAFFVFGLLLSWVITGVVALVIADKSQAPSS